ncbi:MAG: glucoamylase family protein [Bryobacteraceae bacterium]
MPEPSSEMKVDRVQPPGLDLSETEQADLRKHAMRAVRSCAWLRGKRSSGLPREIFFRSANRLSTLERELYKLKTAEPSDDLTWLYDNLRLVRTDIQDLREATKTLARLPLVRTPTDECIPRCIVLARSLLAATRNQLSEPAFSSFIDAVQQVEPLRLFELSGMIPALKLVLLELLAERGWQALEAFRAEGLNARSYEVGHIITSLRFLGEIDWKETLEQLSVLHRILCLDPAGVYPRMEFESRESYRRRIAKVAIHSDVSEFELARLTIDMARRDRPEQESRIRVSNPEILHERLRHIGYYLLDPTGFAALFSRIGYRPPVGARLQRFFHQYPDEVYIIGIEALTLITVVTLIMSIVRTHGGAGLIVSTLLLILPATQAAVELINHLVTAVLTPHGLPKLDFSKGVDPSCATMVAIPTLLLNEKQIRQLVDDLEVRYLVNRDPYIHYALLTDLPDSAEPADEHDPRIDLAVQLINGLNRKYESEPYGGFYLFHRHRVYNPREGAWMGWERKRGKLLELNHFLRQTYDPFPVKAGDLSRLPHIRYVLTLDSDTQLPRSAAQRMIGTMAHPLNRPLIDPELNIVTEGYGILQPRVDISVHSASRSRLASIYSGQTGFDIYSRAVSDVYQDLYGEGIFAGKGIYDVDAFSQVLEHRFPRNALLSHDLIEGAYARAGLASDIEVIDDYPSHYSAYNRRKHRWLRGDWQILRWIFNHVPNESGKLVPNPISLVSRWKIVDNLRRSLIEPATFFLLVAGWFFLPGGPRFWTLVTIALLFLPIYFRLVFALCRAVWKRSRMTARNAVTDFFTSHVSILLNIAFLAHQTLVSLDAIVRTIIRSTITHSRLLEWETATEAELGIQKRTLVDVYLEWTPVVAIGLGLGLFKKPEAAGYALPFIIAWCSSKLVSLWINRSPHTEGQELSDKDRRFLREVALTTWRYFAEFSNEKNNWLIPDNVQEQPYRIAERISPTNLGFLLNARQAALEFGYLNLTEFVSQTELTLKSVLKLPRYFGHFLNWYETITFEPIPPLFLSSVDSGNFAASLWTLKQGCLELLHRPVFPDNALEGLADHYRILGGRSKGPQNLERLFALKTPAQWLPQLLQMQIDPPASKPARAKQNTWWLSEIQGRIDAVRKQARDFMPWYLPEYEALRRLPPAQFDLPSKPLTPQTADAFYGELDRKLQALTAANLPAETIIIINRLRDEIPACRMRLNDVASRLTSLAAESERLVREMDFGMLTDKRRKLLSIGYDVAQQQLSKSCYDLLASESRTAAFIAVAKSEVVQETWFRLGRQHTLCEGENVLISWTGTMFEYLMPVIWMKSHPQTLLDRTVRSAVRAQKSYATKRRVPWGISEAAYSKTDQDGNYQYAAFGVPGLALNVARAGSLVVSPYSSCLALMIDSASAVENLRAMVRKGWLGDYGFYESADYTSSPRRRIFAPKYELVRCWMAHHQGMTMAALCNIFHGMAFQRWFHAEPLVQASELILQERPLRVRPIADSQPRRLLSFTRTTLKGAAAKTRASA